MPTYKRTLINPRDETFTITTDKFELTGTFNSRYDRKRNVVVVDVEETVIIKPPPAPPSS